MGSNAIAFASSLSTISSRLVGWSDTQGFVAYRNSRDLSTLATRGPARPMIVERRTIDTGWQRSRLQKVRPQPGSTTCSGFVELVAVVLSP